MGAEFATLNTSGCCGYPGEEPCNNGDTGMMMLATAFVMLQTPAMGLAQAGLIRRKNALSMLMQTLTGFVYGSILWWLFGFSWVFGKSWGSLGILGNFDNAFFMNVGIDTCFVPGTAPNLPGMVFAAFQMMFAVMVPVIVTGAWAERMTFNAFSIFIILWPILVYYPLAHWIWNAEGWLASLGTLDFAGGITIHTASGVASVVVACMLSRRTQVRAKHAQGHHNLPLTVLGGALIWCGWYSFNGASAFAANGQAAVALVNTHMSACAAGFAWCLITYIEDGHWHLTEILNGALAGLAAITPGSGFVYPSAAVIIGLLAGVLAWAWVRHIAPKLRYDDALDVAALQGVPGIFGSLALGFAGQLFAAVDENGVEQGVFFGGNGYFLGVQLLGVVVSIVWSAFWTFVVMSIIKATVGMNVSPEEEEQGLDIMQIGEQAYDDVLAAELDVGTDVIVNKMCDAAHRGSLAEVKQLVRAGSDPTVADYDGRTPLHLASAAGHLHIARYIVLGFQPDVDAADNFGNTALADAIFHNHTKIAQFLRSHGSEDAAIVNSTYFRQKDIFIAATRGNTELVAHYCGKEPAAAAKEDYDKRTPLHLAATEGHTNVVKMLLAAKADVNAEDRWGNCPLEGAIRHRHKGVIEILRDAGADAPGVHETQPSAGGGGGSAANEVVVELEDLAAASTEVSTSARLLIDAASRGDLAELKNLKAKGANLNAEDYDGRTPLHLAAACNQVHIVEYLCRQPSVRINVFDRFEHTPLQEAQALEGAGTAVVNLLKAHGAVTVEPVLGSKLCAAAAVGNLLKLKQYDADGDDLNCADYDGRTALHLAACNGHPASVLWLLSRGVNVSVLDRFGHTPLDDARREGHETCELALNAAV